jgi:hypothetical protein
VDADGVGNACEAYGVSDTSQTKCYNESGSEIACPSPGAALYVQDANYTINPPSYTKLGQNAVEQPDDSTCWLIVRDNVTGLIWEMKTNDGTIHDKDNLFSQKSSGRRYWHDPENR